MRAHTQKMHKSWVQGDRMFGSWHLMLVHFQYGRHFMSPFWHPEFSGGTWKNLYTHTHNTYTQNDDDDDNNCNYGENNSNRNKEVL